MVFRSEVGVAARGNLLCAAGGTGAAASPEAPPARAAASAVNVGTAEAATTACGTAQSPKE